MLSKLQSILGRNMADHGALWRRGMALVLALVLFFGCWVTPIAAYAAEITDPSETTEATTGESTPETTVPEESTTETTVPEESTTETTVPEESTTETTVPEESTTETTVPEESTTETTVPEESTTETTVPEESTTETTLPEETEPEETEGEPTEEALAAMGGIMLMSLLPETVVDGGEIPNSDLYWKVTQSEEGAYTLTISGEGAMPDYTDATKNYAPWRMLGSNTFKLVFGEGVTRVGAHSIRGMNVTSIQFSSTITTIGKNAFSSCPKLTSVTIPGTVKTVGDYAFNNCGALTSITLEEGVTVLGDGAFANSGRMSEIYIPASVTAIGAAAFTKVDAYAVSPNNPNFTAVDGVLYTRDMTQLVDYPKYRTAEEYTVPDTVTTLRNNSLRNIKATVGKIVIPATVQSADYHLIYGSTGVKALYIEDGALAGRSYGYLDASSLIDLRLPENTKLSLDSPLSNCNSLQSFTIPNGTSTIKALCSTALPYLKEIIYDASSASFTSSSVFLSGTSFDLTIGPHVDTLKTTFSYLTAFAEHIYFAPENQFTIEEGAFDAFGDPLSSVSGTAWVDSQGCLYIYDAETLSAQLAYCPPDVTSVTVPATITIPNEEDPENPTVCTVNGVTQFALSRAEDLESITFSAAENILTLAAYALGDCPTLTSVNGKSTISEALATFPNVESVGWRVLFNTRLTESGSDSDFGTTMAGSSSLLYSNGGTEMSVSVGSSGETTEWVAGEDGTTGGYRLLTGDSIVFTAVAENKEDSSGNSYCRVYLRLTDSTGSLSITPGETYTFDSRTATCYATEDPLTVYLEFELQPGDTISTPVNVVYPTPGSGGGGVTVWGVVLDADQRETYAGKLVNEDNGSLQAFWTTERENFKITKQATNVNGIWRSIVGDTTTQEVTLNADPEWYLYCKRVNDKAATYGRDPVDSITYTDTFTLPEGITLKDEVIAGLNSGMSLTWSGSSIYLNGIRILEIAVQGYSGSNTSALKLMSLKYSYEEETRTITTSWRIKNISTSSAQIPSFRILFKIGRQSLLIDPEAYLAALNNNDPDAYPDASNSTVVKKTTLTNTVNAALHYRYSGDDSQDSEDQKNGLTLQTGTLDFAKKVTETPTYFGEDISWQIYMQNTKATPFTGTEKGSYKLYDPLPYTTYIKPANMEKMFQEAYGQYLTITISNAQLAPYEKVTDIYGGTAYRTSGNSDLDTTVTGQTLTVTRNESGTGYLVSVSGGDTYSGTTAAEALQNAGYAVTTMDTYACTWIVNPDSDILELKAGERWEYNIYATVKDTFTMLNDHDWRTTYPPNTSVSISNTAKLLRPSQTESVTSPFRQTSKVTSTAIYEAEVDKRGVVVGGEPVDPHEMPTVRDSDVMEYTLYFTHHGDGVYENLPLVDDLYGSQYLLAPIAKNPSLADRGLQEYDGCYVLTEGEYTDVVIGQDENGKDCTAASISVQIHTTEQVVNMADTTYYYTGLHTRIKWYYSELWDTGAYETTVTYNTLVATGLTSDGAEYALGNMVFANDKEGYRIWECVWGHFIKVDLQKTIVTERGATVAEDTLAEEGYSTVYEGDKVTYRLMLNNISDVPIVMTGEKTADALPTNAGVFQWAKNVNITVEAAPESAGKIDGLDDWYIGDSYRDLEAAAGQQYLLWPETTKFRFDAGEKLYLYVTLSYPANEGEDTAWDDYSTALKGGAISNRMYIYKQPSSVSHYLGEPGAALLQKGVYAITYYTTNSWYLTCTPSREYYKNTDSSNRQVVYYATVYNGADKRLYLNDLVDDLPKGFSYLYLCATPSLGTYTTSIKNLSSITTMGGLSSDSTSRMVTAYGGDVTYRSAKVTAQYANGDITFKFGAGTGDYAVKYDAQVGKYYLDKGEAIVFGYACTVGSRTATDDIATNTISMAYTDYTGTGVELAEAETFCGTTTDVLTDRNDGNNLLLTTEEADAMGIPTAEESEKYLASTVTVYRGGIQPGITKSAVSYTSAGGNAVSYENSVGPYDTVNWCVKLTNDGDSPLYEYTVTDTIPYPYVFTGNIGINVVNAAGVSRASGTLFTIPEHDHTATSLVISNNTNWKITFGNGKSVGNSWSVLLKMDREEVNGKLCEKITLRMVSNSYAIPEGGYVELTFQSYNPTGEFENTVYTNHATLTPIEAQPFTQASQGSILRDDDGNPVSVTASAPINVSFGYATGAEKRVTQKGTTNTAASTDDVNYIYLPDADSAFTYSLTVHNDSGEPMDKLVIIDNLPEEGDHSPFDTTAMRESAFKVKFADTPNVTVTMTSKQGNSWVLDPSAYRVEYQTGTTFGDDDWDGTSTTWTAASTDARSIRVVILDADASDGETIPKDVSVTVSFDAVIEGDAKEDEIAWNSFGYHYSLRNIPVALEAMPLSVGVKIGKPPTLQKELKTYWGEDYAAEEDSEFRFLVYTGDPLTEEYDSDEELMEALTAAGRSYQQFAVTVSEGQQTSELTPMSATGWRWSYGQKYTIVELDTGSKYSCDNFNGRTGQNYTFTYYPNDPESILCQNLMMRWSIDLTKVGEESKPLSGAVFALYSPNPEEQMETSYHLALSNYVTLSDQPASTITDDNDTWYLKDVQTSDADGKITFRDLFEEEYKLIEVSAPEGYYNTHKKGQIITRTDYTEKGVASVKLINKKLLVMPQTGGIGAYLPMFAGVLLLFIATCLLFFRKRKDTGAK